MSEPSLIAALAEICATARTDATMDFLDIQFAFARESRPRTPKTIERFEDGTTWPTDPQATVAAYAEATGVPAWELWQMAIDRWRASEAEEPAPAKDPSTDRPQDIARRAGVNARARSEKARRRA